MIKVAHPSELPLVKRIMTRIHEEEPSYWPYGLDADQFNGGLYLVQKSASAEPVGFVGWQQFPENERNVGYYAIGILPEHREQGFAKQAVTQVIREIGSQCDEIKAMVMKHNEPSKALAKSLDVPMIEKEANTAKTQAVHSLLGALGTSAFFDQAADPERSMGSTLQPWKWDKERALMGGLNALLGGVGAQQMSTGNFGRGLGAIALAPTKDLAMKGISSLHNFDDAASSFADENKQNLVKSIPKGAWLGAGGLGLGALGLLAYKAKREADHRNALLAEEAKGRVRITLPTKQPGDNETEVELPFDELNLSKALRGRLSRDTRRRLLSETKQRTKRRPKKDSPTDKENKALDKEREELDKEASISEILGDLVDEISFYKSAVANPGPTPAPQGAVPTPPQLGQNPALRMGQQEQAVAQAIQPAPDANPQIMEAEQAAMQAEQAGAQQAAQMEQQAQQAQMEQQQQFQEAMMKSEQEKETLRLQLEKEKAMAEMNKAQAKMNEEVRKASEGAAADASKGEGTAAQQLVSNRLSRLSQKVKAAAAMDLPNQPPPPGHNPVPAGTPGTIDPNTGQEVAEPPVYLKPNAAQRINSHPGATGMIPNTGVYRHSGGPILDSLYGLFRQNLMRPTPPKPTRLSRSSMLNTPDKMAMIDRLYSGATSAMSNPLYGMG